MRVLLINGSPHKNGNTFIALSEAAKTLEKNGIEAEIVQIGVKPVRGCIACGQCKAKQLGKCTFDDDICTNRGDKACFISGETVTLNIAKGFKTVEIFKDSVLYKISLEFHHHDAHPNLKLLF